MSSRDPGREVLSNSAIVALIAEAAAERVAQRVIADLGRLNFKLSGEDCPLKTIWDEICVQRQHEQSYFWGGFVETMERVIELRVTALPQHEYDAIWLQTECGAAWCAEIPELRETAPATLGDVIEYMAEEHILRAADRWTNVRIRAYIDRAWESD